MKTPITRFTNVVEDYIRYRPSYPAAVLQLMRDQFGLTSKEIIADVGSGTGLLSQLLLDNGNTVYGVEPNQAMREAGENILQKYSNFLSINGTAEATTLDDASVDVITVATAFHWFDREKTKQEFRRILRKNGWVLLVWNVRDIEKSALLRDYEDFLLTYGNDYKESNAITFEKTLGQDFFAPNKMHTAQFPNAQQFDWIGLQGRLLSTSYALRPGDARYEAMIDALRLLFERHQKEGVVYFPYQTKCYFGHIHDCSA